MTEKQLKELGLSDENITRVLAIHKETLDGGYIPKYRFDEVNGELKTTKEQVTERDNQIKALKTFEGDNESLKTKIKELEDANKTKDTEYNNALNLEKKKNLIKLALLSSEEGKPHDVDMVMGLFNIGNIVIDDNGKIVSGFKEQNENIRKEKSFLFSEGQTGANEEDKNKDTGFKPAGTTPPDGSGGNNEPDKAVTFGKTLAQIKLGMMGIPTEKE